MSDDIAVWIHLTFVSVWLGGLIIASFVGPALREGSAVGTGDRTQSHDRQPARFEIAVWAALVGALFSGMWLILMKSDPSPEYTRLLFLKLTVVVFAAAGVGAQGFWVGPRLRGMRRHDIGGGGRSQSARSSTGPRALRLVSWVLAASGIGFSLLALWLGLRLVAA
ncbi:MAG: hypothetical protein DYH08_05470 [Actinobacteria bacterium ATB1]|nr:hypothetical protein [Actinobacteria bacterium ATB1]